MKVLITGVNGFIGSHIYEGLKKKYDVIGISRSKTSDICNQYISCDLTDRDSLEEIIKSNSDIDIIIHCAALAHNKGNNLSFDKFQKVNFEVTKDLVDLSNKYLNLNQFIFLSTISVYGEQMNKSIYTEDDECYPKSPYAVAKKKSEEYIQANCQSDYYILRLAPVYSDEFKLNIKRRTEMKGLNYIVGKGDNKLSLCNVNNIVIAVKEIIKKNVDENEIYNISDKNTYSFLHMVEINKVSKIKIIIPKILIKTLYNINKFVMKKQFIHENSIKLISDNIYSSKKICKNINLKYELNDLR